MYELGPSEPLFREVQSQQEKHMSSVEGNFIKVKCSTSIKEISTEKQPGRVNVRTMAFCTHSKANVWVSGVYTG